MPNPTGNLAGWSDPSEPGWQERLQEKVEEYHRSRLHARRRVANPLRSCHMDFTYSAAFSVILRDAAKARGMSKISYVRRAVIAFLAHDTGLEFNYIASLTPKIIPPGTFIPGSVSEGDDGHGFGSWQIERLK